MRNIFFTVVILSILAMLTVPAHTQTKQETAIFAGGCFWCMTPPFEDIEGVAKVISGYTGGQGQDPNYDDYAQKGHIEAIEVTYDPAKVQYEQLLEVFWSQIDPTDNGGQFVDRGPQYGTAIFYANEEQKIQAEKSRETIVRSGRYEKPIITPIVPASTFYPAEEYHQEYHKKNPLRYKIYRANSGRDQYLAKVCAIPVKKKSQAGKYPEKAELRKRLAPLQYHVTQENGTEPPFLNEYWDNKKEGIYIDIVSGEPLFSSRDKYDSGTGWPSFIRPLEPKNIVERSDRSFFSVRTEIRSAKGDSHLGHVFNDGPAPTGFRYCTNSAALRFIPKEDLEKQGYGQYLPLFNK